MNVVHTETSEINRVGVPRCHTPTELQYLLHIYAKLWLHLKLTSLVQNWRNLYYIKIVKRLKQRFAFLVCVSIPRHIKYVGQMRDVSVTGKRPTLGTKGI